MIYNKKLGITDEMISEERDLETLSLWRRSIEVQMTELLKSVDSKDTLSKQGKVLYKCLISFRKILNTRIGEIKTGMGYRSERSLRKDRTLSMLFQQKAKEILDKNTYEEILDAAKAEIAD